VTFIHYIGVSRRLAVVFVLPQGGEGLHPMSEATTNDSSTATSTDQTDEQTLDGPTVVFCFSGPATYTRPISGGEQNNIVSIHDSVTVEGTLELDAERLFDIVDPTSYVNRTAVLNSLLNRPEIRDGYTVEDTEEWTTEIQGAVDDWCQLAQQFINKQSYTSTKTREAVAIKKLMQIHNAGILGESGLLAILELNKQAKEDILSNDNRQNVLTALEEFSDE